MYSGYETDTTEKPHVAMSIESHKFVTKPQASKSIPPVCELQVFPELG